MKNRPAPAYFGGALRRVQGGVFLVMCFLFLYSGLSAQGWQFNFGAEKTDEGWAVLQTEDQGFLVVGFGESFGINNDQDIFVIRTDIDGTLLWSTYFDEGFQEQARAILPTSDGNFLIVGNIINKVGENENIFLLKIDRKGRKIWSKQFGTSLAERASGAAVDADGSFLVAGSIKNANEDEDILLVRFDSEGNTRWAKSYGTPRADVGAAIVVLPGKSGFALAGNSRNEKGFDNDIVLYRLDTAGKSLWDRRIGNSFREEVRDLLVTKSGELILAGLYNDNPDAFVAKFDLTGNLLWERTVGESGVEEEANAITELTDGSLVLTGLKVIGMVNVDIFIAKLSSEGQILWQKNLGDPQAAEEARDIRATADGGYVLTGYNAQVLTSFNDLILVKTDGDGNLISNFISGRVFLDGDGGCDNDSNEQPLKGWLVQAEGQGKVFYSTTDGNGFYRIPVDSGRYNVRALPLNLYWDACIPQGVTISFPSFYDSVRVDFPMKPGIVCPFLEVGVATPFLAPCQDLEYTVNYCNIGTGQAENAYVELTLDPRIAFVSATRQHQVTADGKFRFPLGSVPATGCGSFLVRAKMACTGIAEGQAAFVAAHIFPDVSCLQPDPNWDGASLSVRGSCEGDTVTFQIRNEGAGDMKSAKRSIVIQDNIVLRQNDIQLRANEEQTIKVPAIGATYRVVVEQSSGHPGRSYPTAAVEGCATQGLPVSTGKVTMFPENDFDPFVSIDVQEITASPLPVELRGYPKGYRDSLIAPETDLTFKVLFKNTSADTITRIVIRDTLPSWLDPRKVTPGASNFTYRMDVYANGIVKISIDSILLLPAGSSNAGFGFVEFRVGQKPNTPLKTVIENRATVFFDYQTPVTTKILRYVVDQFPDFITVITSSKEVFQPGVRVKVYPNPSSESVTFDVEGPSFRKLHLSVFDLDGKLVKRQVYSGNQFTLFSDQLPSGMYVYRLEAEGKLINTGKFIFR
ncbi:MAG: T9SS type A sorting domain-containing protein [Haliscomenobacter sp.]|nr:T9SS type A sorting domain-containing protein [Haliscomenobacter sp.]